jgi:hypothetical protein
MKFKKVFLFLIVCGHGRRRNSIQAQDLWNELNNVYILYLCADITDVVGRGGRWVVCGGPCRVSKLVHGEYALPRLFGKRARMRRLCHHRAQTIHTTIFTLVQAVRGDLV